MMQRHDENDFINAPLPPPRFNWYFVVPWLVVFLVAVLFFR